jgi:hypothetical protein
VPDAVHLELILEGSIAEARVNAREEFQSVSNRIVATTIRILDFITPIIIDTD